MHALRTRAGSALLLLIALVPAGCAGYGAGNSAAPATYRDDVLAARNGMTLYTYDKDPRGAGISVCNDGCARNWPPLLAAPDAEAVGNFSIIRRDDGSRQWAYRGKPLYFWVKDHEPGDRTGDDVKGVWHVVERSGPPRTGY